MERSPLSTQLVSAEDDQNLEVVIDDLTEAIDEFYTQYFYDPQERKERLRQMMLQGLAHHNGPEEAPKSLPAERADHSHFNVELIALETQLEQAQQNISALEKSLETQTRELETRAAENSRWREQYAALQRQQEDSLAAIQIWKTRTQEALAAKAPFETALPPAIAAPQETNAPVPMNDFAARAERFARAYTGKSGATMTVAQLGETFERAAKTFEVLLQTTLKLMHGRLNFRDRYIDHNDAVKPADALLHRAYSVDDLKAFVFSPALSEADFAERLRALKRELVYLFFHQLALLNGYRACVSDGSRKLLEELEPNALQQESNRKGTRVGPWQLPNALAQLFAPGQFFSLYRRRYADLLQEDRGYLFEKIFNPRFLRGYQACMASTQKMATTTLNFSKANGVKASH